MLSFCVCLVPGFSRRAGPALSGRPVPARPCSQEWSGKDPKAACEVMLVEYKGLDFGMFRVYMYFPGAALEKFEEIKRATKRKISGSGKLN